jgi:uncharacterized protein (TIGR03083 family)
MSLDYLEHIRSDSARFADLLAGADPSATVPSCPDWTAADLLWHLAEVQNFWGAIVRDRLLDPDAADRSQPSRPSDYGELVDTYRAASSGLVDALATTPDKTTVWTWFAADQSAGFVRRRQAHEALIHRLDAELTTGTVTDLDAGLATDGVAEVLEWMYSEVPEWATAGPDGPTGRLATSDTGREWLVRIGSWSGTSPNTGNTYTDEGTLSLVASGEPDFEVSGAARDLDAWLWNRPTWEQVRLTGDYQQFQQLIRTGVQ